MAGRITLLVFILAVGGVSERDHGDAHSDSRREVNNANLVGKNVSEASQMLQSRGLVLRVADESTATSLSSGGAADATSGLLMKWSAAGARGAEPGGSGNWQIPLLKAIRCALRESNFCGGIAGGRSFGVTMTEQPVDPWSFRIRSPARGGNASRGRAGFARSA